MMKRSRQVLEKETIEYKAAQSEAMMPHKTPVANKNKKKRIGGNQTDEQG
jgi:hypothetical protein